MAGFWQGRRVFLTGHTGFKGAWLSLWLKQLGAEVWGFSLPAGRAPPRAWAKASRFAAPETRNRISSLASSAG